MSLKLLWGLFMVIIYLGMASLLLFSDVFVMQKTLKIIIGILLFLYGLFRGYRVWKNGY